MKSRGATQRLELLAPAKNLDIGIAAIDAGADAVYIGPESFGARAKASNSLDDIRALVDYALPFGVKIYATVNTIIYDSELSKAERLITGLWHSGVDALIVQDPALLSLDIPPISLHASTQCDIRDADKARLLAALGFDRLVVARELSPNQIDDISRAVPDTEIEAFVHGALCVSYSGDCHAGYALTGRSANRGECPQICRLKYSLLDNAGRALCRDAHLLSLKDMNRIGVLDALADAGVRSFKIEGRLKDADYVRVVVANYRRAIDRLIDASDGRYGRSSRGSCPSSRATIADLDSVFNRDFTNYILSRRPGENCDIARTVSPKWLGKEIGAVDETKGNKTRIALLPGITLNNGDGLTAVSPDGEVVGFRINRAEGNIAHTSTPCPAAKGWKAYRNADMAFDSAMAGRWPKRELPITMTFEARPDIGLIRLEVKSGDGPGMATAASRLALTEASNNQTEARRKALSKLGDTPYKLTEYRDKSPETFVPLSAISSLKRQAVSAFTHMLNAIRRRPLRRPPKEAIAADIMAGKYLDYHWNIANHLSQDLYTSLGANVAEMALEHPDADPGGSTPLVVMTTRHCLRRHLGACLKEANAGSLPEEMYLIAPGIRLKVEFDCAECQMRLLAQPTSQNNTKPHTNKLRRKQ